MSVKCISEEGCPVAVDSARAEAQIDPFSKPVALKIFIDYRNNTDKAISAVKFRVLYLDGSGQERGRFLAIQEAMVSPRGHSSEKFRAEKIHPNLAGLALLPIAVKFGDGSSWESPQADSEPAESPQDKAGENPTALQSPQNNDR